MKKFLVVALVLSLFAVPALAEGIDLIEMSLDELVALRSEISQEITVRTVSGDNVIHSGEYVVGTDIREGYYLVTSSKVFDTKQDYIWVCVRDNESHLTVTALRLNEGQSGNVMLSAGQTLEIDYGDAMIETAAKPSWAP